MFALKIESNGLVSGPLASAFNGACRALAAADFATVISPVDHDCAMGDCAPTAAPDAPAP